MSNLAAYRAVIDALQHTPAFKRYIQMMESEDSEQGRISAIEEWRKQTISRLKETLSPEGRKGDLKAYRDNLAWKKTLELNKAKGL